MATTADTIDRTTLEHLVEAGAIRGASIVGQPGGWGVVFQYGLTERVLAARRGAIRNYRKFETLVDYLKSIGIAKYQVDATGYAPVVPASDRKRTDAAQRIHRGPKGRRDLRGRIDVHAREEVLAGRLVRQLGQGDREVRSVRAWGVQLDHHGVLHRQLDH